MFLISLTWLLAILLFRTGRPLAALLLGFVGGVMLRMRLDTILSSDFDADRPRRRL